MKMFIELSWNEVVGLGIYLRGTLPRGSGVENYCFFS